jgi:hypothetical protein
MVRADRFVVFVVLAVLLTLTGAGQARIARDMDKLSEVRAGMHTEANALWWGFDPEDATDSLQAAINSGVSRLIIPNVGQEWVVRPLTLRSNLELILEEGVVIAAKRGEYHGSTDSVFNATDADNLIIRGYGATVRMNKADYMSPDYKKAEWRMGFRFLSCRNVEIHGVTVRDTGGDGIYLGRSSSGRPNENIVIRDVTADNNYRQGISVITARNLLIENCVFNNTGGTAPSAGIDLEPNRSDEALENIIVRNCVFENNDVLGIHVYLNYLTGPVGVSVLWENNIVRGGDYGLHVRRIHPNGPHGQIVFRGCIVENTRLNGIRVRSVDADSVDVIFEDCLLANVATELTQSEVGRPVYSPISVLSEISDPADEQMASRVGGITFKNVVVVDNRERPAVAGIPENKDALKAFADINGEIYVHNPFGAWAEWDGPTEVIDLRLQAVAEPAAFRAELLERFEKGQAAARDAAYSWPAARFDIPTRGGVQGVVDAGIRLANVDPGSVKRVEILLDNDLIYSGSSVPEAGQVMVDTRTLADGRHTLTAMVVLDVEYVDSINERISFTTRNFWDLRDELNAPKETGGWFGVIELARTFEESAGWEYSTDREDEFFGDESRKVRQGNTTEYLVWETPLLGEFALTLYAKENAIGDIVELAVSSDGRDWQSVTYTVTEAGPSAQGWYQLVLAGHAADYDDVDFFRLTLHASDAPVEVQIGEARFSGMRRPD